MKHFNNPYQYLHNRPTETLTTEQIIERTHERLLAVHIMVEKLRKELEELKSKKD